jgi:hypothetical protein
MANTWVLSALWVGLALVATLLCYLVSHVDGALTITHPLCPES